MITGAILAGGQNRRMNGRVKALLPFSGELMIQHQVKRMKVLCPEIIVVTNQPEMFLPVLDRSVRIITDYFPGKGPLSGMHAAFSLAKHPDVWIVGCDMPFISPRAAQTLWGIKKVMRCDAVLPVLDGTMHPLHGLYSKNCSDAASALLLSGQHRLTELLRMIYWQEAPEACFREQGIDLKFVAAVHDEEDYQAALRDKELIL